MSPRTWLLLGLVTATVTCGPARTPPPAPGGFHLTVTPDGQLMTVRAAGIPRSALLGYLAAEYGVEVRAHDVPDGPVTLDRENVPLLVGVASLFPAGSRFAIRPGKHELAVPGSARGAKRGERPRPAAGLTPKGKGPEPKRDQMKGKPAERLPSSRPGGPGLKPEARDIAPPLAMRGPKLARGIAQPDSSLQLTFSLTATGRVTLVGRQQVEGTLPASTMVQGPFLVLLRDAGGAVVFAQALVDPLEQHSYLPDGTHDLTRASEGTFTLLLPPALADRSRLAGLTLEFIDGRELSLPTRLDSTALLRLSREAKPVSRLPGQSLFEPLNQPR